MLPVQIGTLAALAVLCALPVWGQSLGEAARRAEETRSGPRASLVFDATDLDAVAAWQEVMQVRLDAPGWARFVRADRGMAEALAAEAELRERVAGLRATSIRTLERFLQREPALLRAITAAGMDARQCASVMLAFALAIENGASAAGTVGENAAFLAARRGEVRGLTFPTVPLVARASAPTGGRVAAPEQPSDAPTEASSPSSGPRPDTGGPITVRPGDEIPDFGFVDFSGASRRLSDFRGRYVLLDFWGMWCGPCRAEVPHAKAAYERYRSRGFEILALDYERGENVEPLVRQYLEANGVTWTFATPSSALDLVRNRFRIRSFPTLILLDREARVMDVPESALRGEALSRTLDRILQ